MICIPLTQGKHAIIDNDDWELVSNYKWYATIAGSGKKLFYARSTVTRPDGTRFSLKMHRVILGLQDDKISVDHIDGNTLNNSRSNLRICTHQQNACNRRIRSDNTSKYKGVSYRKESGLWRARICSDGAAINLGHFQNPQDAYAAYCDAAKSLHGSFAKLN